MILAVRFRANLSCVLKLAYIDVVLTDLQWQVGPMMAILAQTNVLMTGYAVLKCRSLRAESQLTGLHQ